MKNIMQKVLAAFVGMLSFPMLCHAYTASDTDHYLYKISTSTSVVVMGIDEALEANETLIIPDVTKIGGKIYDVVGIGDKAFMNNTTLKVLKYSIGVLKSIGSYAFYGCTNLEQITYDLSKHDAILTDDINTIGDYAFANCPNLVAFHLIDPSADCALGKYIFNKSGLPKCYLYTDVTEGMFEGCTKLSSVMFSNTSSTTYDIKKRAFYGCTALVSITLSGYDSIGEEAFANSGLTSVVVPASVATIEVNAFAGTPLVTAKLSCLAIKEGAFRNSTLKDLEYNCSTGTIYEDAFIDCAQLAKVKLVCNQVRERAFAGSTALQTADVKATTIYARSFAGCTGMKTLTIDCPTIYESAFEGCSGLVTTTMKQFPDPTSLSNCNPCFQGCTGSLIIEPKSLPTLYTTSMQNPFIGSQFTTVTVNAYAQNLLRGMPALEKVIVNSPTATFTGSIAYACPNLTTYELKDAKGYQVDPSGFVYFQEDTKLEIVAVPSTMRVLKLPAGTTSFRTYSLAYYQGVVDATALTALPKKIDTSFAGTVIIDHKLRDGFAAMSSKPQVIAQYPESIYDINEDGKVTISDVNTLIDKAKE